MCYIAKIACNNNFNNEKNFILFKFLRKSDIVNIFANIKFNNKKSVATNVKSNNKKSVATNIVFNNKKSIAINVKFNKQKNVLFLFIEKRYLRLLAQFRENFNSSTLSYRLNNIFNIYITKKL